MSRSEDGGRRNGALPPAPARIAAFGEGLLEVGVHPALAGDVLARGYGGDAANAAVMAARLGARTELLTRLGDDAAGRLLHDFWRGQGVGVAHVGWDERAATGLYVNEVGDDGAHRFSYHRAGSAASLIGPADVEPGWFAGLDVLHVSGIGLAISDSAAAAAERAAELARAAGAAVSFAVNFRPQLQPDRERLIALARAADVVFLSAEDARGLLGLHEPSAEEALAALGGGAAEVVFTQGEQAAWLRAGGRLRRLEPPRVVLADAAGAGDALAGAYLARRFAGNRAPARAVEAFAAGVAAGALSCEGSGCALGYPGAEDVARVAQRLLEGDAEKVS
jgi:2-dehydro-3-deoxygluconokinase